MPFSYLYPEHRMLNRVDMHYHGVNEYTFPHHLKCCSFLFAHAFSVEICQKYISTSHDDAECCHCVGGNL